VRREGTTSIHTAHTASAAANAAIISRLSITLSGGFFKTGFLKKEPLQMICGVRTAFFWAFMQLLCKWIPRAI
jgi:hypothetical protein